MNLKFSIRHRGKGYMLDVWENTPHEFSESVESCGVCLKCIERLREVAGIRCQHAIFAEAEPADFEALRAECINALMKMSFKKSPNVSIDAA